MNLPPLHEARKGFVTWLPATAAKAEVDAFVTGVVRAAGIEAIAGGKLPALLPPVGTPSPKDPARR